MRLTSTHKCALAVSLALVVGAGLPVRAEYIQPDLDNVPVNRLIENLEALAKKDEKAVTPRLNLARAHAMAYAQKTDTARVLKGKEDQGPWFGFEPKLVPFEVKKTDDEAKLKAAREHLDKAIARYEEVIKLDDKQLVAKLGHAWCLDQAKKKDEAIKEYRAVIDEAWAKEKDLKAGVLGGHYVTAEAGGYLIPLLDEDKDKDEIATLKDRAKKLNALPRPITPIVVPLRDGLGVADLEDRHASVAFDADGSGLKRQWTWITPEAGWLVYDPHKTGKVTSGLQLFGSVTFWCFWDNGYQALQSLDDNGDGMLTGNELDGLAIWHDVNSNGVCDPGEVRPLSEYGIVGISCRCVRDANHPDRIMYSAQGVVFSDGSTRPTFDIILRRRVPNEPRDPLLGMRIQSIQAVNNGSSSGSSSDSTGKENKVPEDRSLALDEYLEAGVPAHDRPWSSADIARAAKALATLAAKDPGQLPRASSKRSGDLFARIISSKNLDLYRDKSLPLNDRSLLLGYMKRTVPAIAPRLPEKSQKELLKRIEEMSKDDELKDLADELKDLGKLVQDALKPK